MDVGETPVLAAACPSCPPHISHGPRTNMGGSVALGKGGCVHPGLGWNKPSEGDMKSLELPCGLAVRKWGALWMPP